MLCSASVQGGHFDKYFEDDSEKARYYIPAEDEPVLGTQKTWYTTPYDLKLGTLNMNCRKIDAVTDKYFEVTPSSVVGKFTYRFTPLAEENQVENELHDRRVLSTEYVLFSQLSKVKDRNILIGCRVTKIFPEGRGFEATVEFAGGALPFRVEVVRAEDVNRLPEVHSRQYGPHAKHVFDVYYPEGFKPGEDKPLPMVINIHGGGWGALDKMNNRIGEEATSWNEAGIAFVSVNYRYVSEYEQHPVMTVPVAAPLLDAARAIQFIRFHAEELGLDPGRVSLTGGSAGGASSVWLALHDDLADPENEDPVARMSTRVTCSTPHQAQTSLDPQQMKEWIPSITYGAHAFFASDRLPEKGPARFQFFLDHREEILPYIKDFSGYEHASADDPPMLLVYGGQPNVLPATNGGNATHHPQFGAKLHERLQRLGVESYFWAGDNKTPGGNVRASNGRYHDWSGVKNFVKDQLLGPGWDENLDDWYPFEATGLVHENSVISLSDWLPKPAGKRGRPVIRDDQVFIEGRPVRFWVSNNNYGDNAPPKDVAEARSRFLRARAPL
jgi:acetyl esterase/lipase